VEGGDGKKSGKKIVNCYKADLKHHGSQYKCYSESLFYCCFKICMSSRWQVWLNFIWFCTV